MLKEAETINHPYWPRNLSIPNYVANDRSMSEILIFLFSVSGILLLATWSLTGRKVAGSRLSGGRRLALCWFTVCGFIHGVIEGWFSLYYTVIPEDQSFLSQLCEWGSKSFSLNISLVCFEIILWKFFLNVSWTLSLQRPNFHAQSKNCEHKQLCSQLNIVQLWFELCSN